MIFLKGLKGDISLTEYLSMSMQAIGTAFLLPIILELIGIYPKKKSVGPRGHSTTTWTEF